MITRTMTDEAIVSIANNTDVTILVVDDDATFTEAVSSYLKMRHYQVVCAENGQEGLRLFHSCCPALILADLCMPVMDGLEMLATVTKLNQEIPVIMISGSGDMESAITALKLGAWDYLTKPLNHWDVLDAALARCLARSRLLQENRRYREHLESEVHAKTTSLINQLTERRKVDLALRRSELRYRSVIENATDIICTLSFDGKIQSLNSAFERLTDWPAEQWVHKPLRDIMHCQDIENVDNELKRAFSGGATHELECRLRKPTNDYMIGELIASALIEHQQVVGAIVIIRDISDRKKAEEATRKLQVELLQAQKIESIGRLAGGVAHDFNNALTAILGFSELALNELPINSNVREYIEVIKDSGEKAAALTRQLLAFGRKQILKVEQVCLNTVVMRMGRMLQRLIGDHILLHIAVRAKNAVVLADPAQIEQVVMNLVINARDAMQQGGDLWISTDSVELTMDDIGQKKVSPGSFVELTIKDSGIGMTKEVKSHIFEPFFTTKAPGAGTGLGMAMVFGVVRQHYGFITLESEPNRGSVFKVYLPLVKHAQQKKTRPVVEKKMVGGAETLLVVDDEQAIRHLLVTVMSKLGYRIFSAASGKDALELIAKLKDPIDLLLTDVVMPGMDGLTLAAHIKRSYPSVKTLFMSGYTNYTDDSDRQILSDKVFLQKPIKPTLVAQKVRELLDESTMRVEKDTVID